MAGTIDSVKDQLSGSIDLPLVEALVVAYQELKRQYALGNHKPSELEGGHFAEIVVRILDYLTTNSYPALGDSLPKVDAKWLERFAQLPTSKFSDSIRLHIPRAILMICGVRNRRGVGHVGGDVNANLADATLAVAICDWILAELIRLTYTSTPEEAQKLVDSLVTYKVPLIQDFSGYLKVLKPDLSIAKQVLLLAYQRGAEGATRAELAQWIKTSGGTLSAELSRLVHGRRFLHFDGTRYFITYSGQKFVANEIPLAI